VDDVLDEEGAAASLGKTPGKDRAQGKLTYPSAVGIPQSRKIAAALVAEADAFAAAAQDAGGCEDCAPLLTSLSAFVLTRSA
jgi:geranylgeranyl pyrophosphate synthase